MSRRWMGCVLVLSLFAVNADNAWAQSDQNWNVGKFHATREELQQMLARFQEAARSGAYSPGLRERARYEADLIKLRLEQGDFQVGDRISMHVEGEPTLSTDTILVGPALNAVLPSGDTVSLKGVLRSEVTDRLQTAIARVLKAPNVRAQSYIRVTVLGAVGTPGFYVVRSDALLTDVLTVAGGPGATADLKGIRIERGGEKIWEGNPLQEAITQGRTVDQLNLRAGDEIVVPNQKGGVGVANMLKSARSLLFALPLLVALFSRL